MSSAHHSTSSIPEHLPHAGPYRFGIVVAEWNQEITFALRDGALEALQRAGADPQKINTIYVPGSFELTAGASLLLHSGAYDAVICIGCVIQGETRHFDFICHGVTNGCTALTVQHNKPVIFGVLTTETQQQAQDRAGGKYGNKGIESAITAIKMATLFSSGT